MELKAGAVMPWLEEYKKSVHRPCEKLWIDVWGYNPEIISSLAQEFDIHPGEQHL